MRSKDFCIVNKITVQIIGVAAVHAVRVDAIANNTVAGLDEIDYSLVIRI